MGAKSDFCTLHVPQGGVISSLLSNVYLTEVDTVGTSESGHPRAQWTRVEYARFADDLVVLVDGHLRHQWLRAAVERRLREEFANSRSR